MNKRTIQIKSSTSKVTVLKASPAADALAVAVGVLQQLQGMVDGDAAVLKNAPPEIVKLVKKMIGQDKALIEALNGLVGNLKENDENKVTPGAPPKPGTPKDKEPNKKTVVNPTTTKKESQKKVMR